MALGRHGVLLGGVADWGTQEATRGSPGQLRLAGPLEFPASGGPSTVS